MRMFSNDVGIGSGPARNIAWNVVPCMPLVAHKVVQMIGQKVVTLYRDKSNSAQTSKFSFCEKKLNFKVLQSSLLLLHAVESL